MVKVIIVSIITVVLALALWLFLVQETPPRAEGDEAILKANSTSVEVSDAQGTSSKTDSSRENQEDGTYGGRQGKRIVFVPERSGDIDHIDLDAAEEIVTAVELVVQAALDGSQENTLEFVRFGQNCQSIPTSEEDIRAMSQIRQGNQHVDYRISDGLLGYIEFDSHEDWAKALWDRYSRCRAVGELTATLREQLQAMAENGNPSARFMYALWPPKEFLTDTEQILNWLDYEDNAQRFTTANIVEQSPLGLLARGISYKTAGLFTAWQPDLGNAFVLAAIKCDLNEKVSESLLSSMHISEIEFARDASNTIAASLCGVGTR